MSPIYIGKSRDRASKSRNSIGGPFPKQFDSRKEFSFERSAEKRKSIKLSTEYFTKVKTKKKKSNPKTNSSNNILKLRNYDNIRVSCKGEYLKMNNKSLVKNHKY